MCKNMTNGKSTMRERIGPEGRVESGELGSRVSSGLAGGDWPALWHNLAASLYPPSPPIHTPSSFQV